MYCVQDILDIHCTSYQSNYIRLEVIIPPKLFNTSFPGYVLRIMFNTYYTYIDLNYNRAHRIGFLVLIF